MDEQINRDDQNPELPRDSHYDSGGHGDLVDEDKQSVANQRADEREDNLIDDSDTLVLADGVGAAGHVDDSNGTAIVAGESTLVAGEKTNYLAMAGAAGIELAITPPIGALELIQDRTGWFRKEIYNTYFWRAGSRVGHPRELLFEIHALLTDTFYEASRPANNESSFFENVSRWLKSPISYIRWTLPTISFVLLVTLTMLLTSNAEITLAVVVLLPVLLAVSFSPYNLRSRKRRFRVANYKYQDDRTAVRDRATFNGIVVGYADARDVKIWLLATYVLFVLIFLVIGLMTFSLIAWSLFAISVLTAWLVLRHETKWSRVAVSVPVEGETYADRAMRRAADHGDEVEREQSVLIHDARCSIYVTLGIASKDDVFDDEIADSSRAARDTDYRASNLIIKDTRNRVFKYETFSFPIISKISDSYPDFSFPSIPTRLN